jgi:hypothetical protein
MADITDFQLGQGESFKIFTQLKNQTAGQFVDITGYTFRGQLRENYTTEEVAAEFLITPTEPYTSGSFFIELTAEQTAQLEQRKYVYDVTMITDDNPPTVRRILEGGFTIRPAVTR